LKDKDAHLRKEYTRKDRQSPLRKEYIKKDSNAPQRKSMHQDGLICTSKKGNKSRMTYIRPQGNAYISKKGNASILTGKQGMQNNIK
jgi:hypothetical protein